MTQEICRTMPTESDRLEVGANMQRLEYLRGELREERISYGELAELQALAAHIDPDDTELLEAAGIPENGETMTTETKRTPGPWKAYSYEDASPDGQFHCGVDTDYPPALCNGARSIAFMTGCALTTKGRDDRQAVISANLANAAYIVRCCNSHDELVAALQRLLDASATVGNLAHSGVTVPSEAWGEMYFAENAARAALQRAGE